jgi:hypothetical protein
LEIPHKFQAEIEYSGTAMAEWLILLLLVPAIVVPVVLLVGFAGCPFNEGAGPGPTIEAVVPISANTIALFWLPSVDAVDIERTNPDNSTTIIPSVPAPPFNDTGLAPSTVYTYRVRAARSQDGWSSGVMGSTLGQLTFQETLSADDDTWADKTLVQRIEAARLTASGTQVKLVLQASSDGDASIDRIYISQPDPTPGADLYDAAADLTAVYDPPIPTPLVIAANTFVSLPAVHYSLDHTQPLLIAFDFSSSAGSGIRYVEPVPPEEATAFSNPGAEAKLRPRSSGYTSEDRIYFIMEIQVG